MLAAQFPQSGYPPSAAAALACSIGAAEPCASIKVPRRRSLAVPANAVLRRSAHRAAVAVVPFVVGVLLMMHSAFTTTGTCASSSAATSTSDSRELPLTIRGHSSDLRGIVFLGPKAPKAVEEPSIWQRFLEIVTRAWHLATAFADSLREVGRSLWEQMKLRERWEELHLRQRWDALEGRMKIAVAAFGCLAAVGLISRCRRCARRATGDEGTSAIPEEYKAAGVIFFTRDTQTTDVQYILMGVEERKVQLRDLGRGSGTGLRNVLLFPQGKRETYDKGFLDTARREFLEETDDPSGLASYLDEVERTQEWSKKPSWYPPAKLAVVYSEVPRQEVAKLSYEIASRGKFSKFPLRPVWVEAAELRRALASPNTGAEVLTSLGRFPIFPVHRRFFKSADARRWLEMASPTKSPTRRDTRRNTGGQRIRP